MLRRAVRTLAQLTRNVAVVQYPSLSRSRVRHVELVALSSSRLMIVLITDTGRVEQRVVDLPAAVAADTVVDLRNTLNARLHDRLLAEAPAIISDLPVTVSPELRGVMFDADRPCCSKRSSRSTTNGSCWAAPRT